MFGARVCSNGLSPSLLAADPGHGPPVFSTSSSGNTAAGQPGGGVMFTVGSPVVGAAVVGSAVVGSAVVGSGVVGAGVVGGAVGHPAHLKHLRSNPPLRL